MPKERKGRSLSLKRSRTSPFSCSTSCGSRRSSSQKPSDVPEDVDRKEWEEARCSVCMEHPHNAVLLQCSSHDKGCRPYMCDTSYRHSNCLDQFRKAFSEASSSDVEGHHSRSSQVTQSVDSASSTCESQVQPKLLCPLCRGQVNGWIVEERARQFMNQKARSCAQESCTFSGMYADLRKHARMDHPLARPSQADPQRQRDWRRLERQRDLDDVLSTIQSSFGEERSVGEPFSIDDGSWLTVYFLIRVFRPGSGSSIGWSGPSRFRGLSRSRRRTLWGESYDREPSSSFTRDNDRRSRDRESTNPDGSSIT